MALPTSLTGRDANMGGHGFGGIGASSAAVLADIINQAGIAATRRRSPGCARAHTKNGQDGAASWPRELGSRDSNPSLVIQSHPSYH